MTQSIDESFEQAHTPIWRRKRWWFAGVVAIAGFVLALYVVSGWNETARQIRAIRARGEPTNWSELADYYTSPPADQDATRLWLGAFDSLNLAAGTPLARQLPFLGNGGEPPPVGQPWIEIALARQFLQNHAAAMAQLHEAAALGGQARYPVDFSTGITALINHVQYARNAARCLALEAHVRAHSGDLHGAAESIRTGLLLSESLKNEPLHISQLVRIAIHGMIIEQLKRIDPATFPADDLKRLQETLAEIDFGDAIKRAAIGERVLGLTTFDDPKSAGLAPQVAYLLWINRGVDEAAYLTAMTDFIAVADLPWNECVDQSIVWSNTLKARSSRWTILTNMLTPALAQMTMAFARGETVNRLATIDMAIARYRAEHGQPPQDLAALVPAFLETIQVDPTTDSPFTYQVTSDGYLLYSSAKTLFGNATGQPVDPDAGVPAYLVFRWPPLPDEPKESKATEEGDPATMEERVDEAPVDGAADITTQPPAEQRSSKGEP